MSDARTSAASPLRIDFVTVGSRAGLIGMTICPGKHGDSQYGASWERDLTVDLEAIHVWGASILVTLMETDEMQRLGVAGVGPASTSKGLRWVHIPITDGAVPDERFDREWPSVGPQLVRELQAGRKIVIHCRGGLGRTGMVAGMVLIELGETPANALKMVRSARPGAVETEEQESYVLNYRKKF